MSEQVTAALAEFAASFPAEAVPAAVTTLAEQSRVQVLEHATLGAGAPAVNSTLAAFTALGSAPTVQVTGREESLAAWDAPLVTMLSALEGGLPPAAASLSRSALHQAAAAALPLAECAKADPSVLLAAIGVGGEVGVRLELALSPDLTARGWQAGAVAGRFAAAVAAGRLLGLDVDGMTAVLGLAATQVSGWAGSSAGNLVQAKVASDGVEAAALAAAGFRGPAAPLEGRRGMAHVLAPDADRLPDATAEMGRRWRLLEGAHGG